MMEQDPVAHNVRGEEKSKLLVEEYIDESIQYVTKSLLDRQFEFQVKKDLVQAYQRMKNEKSEKRKFIRTSQLSFPSEFLKMKLSDLTKDLGNPNTTNELLQKLETLNQEYLKSAHSSCEGDGSSAPSHWASFPPIHSAMHSGFFTPKVQTPQFQKVFTFGSALPSKGLPPSAAKNPRPMKPGEAVFMFSATGSPVITQSSSKFRINEIPPSDSARVKVDDGHGNVIDVDLVFRNASAAQRNKIVTDFRCMTKTCSLASKKLQPHRAPIKKCGSARKLPH